MPQKPTTTNDDYRCERVALHLRTALENLGRGQLFYAGQWYALAMERSFDIADSSVRERARRLCKAVEDLGSDMQFRQRPELG